MKCACPAVTLGSRQGHVLDPFCGVFKGEPPNEFINVLLYKKKKFTQCVLNTQKYVLLKNIY